MKKIGTIAIAELRTLFFSPIAWLLLILFTVQSAFTFTSGMKATLQSEMMGHAFPGITTWALRYNQMVEYIFLYIPLLTMGLMSREVSSGSIKLLLSSPVSNAQIIFGKYLSMLIYGLLLTSILAIYGLFGFFVIKDFDAPVAIAGVAGIYLLISTYAAIGLFMSCLTSYPVAAAIGTLALFAALNYVNQIWQRVAFVRDITYWLSITGRTSNLTVGLINSEDVLYFLIIISLFIALSILKLNGERFNRSRPAASARFALAVLIAMVLGYLSSRPGLMSFADVTRTKSNTLTPNSQKILSQLRGPLKVTTYVNLFEQNFNQAGPDEINFDRQNLKQYLRFKPDMDLQYVYYYAKTDLPLPATDLPGLTDRQRMERMCVTYDLNPNMFLTEEELSKQIDLLGEHFRFIRVFQTQAGKKVFLRLFDDLTKQPQEREISAALKRLVSKLPTVGFIVGHGERAIDNMGGRGFNQLTIRNSTRAALVNQGFDVKTVDLKSSVQPDVDIVVFADNRTALSDLELNHLMDYTQRGGNFLLIGEPGRQDLINPIAAHFGIVFEPGRLVQPRRNLAADLIDVVPTPDATSMAYEFKYVNESHGVITMNGACGLSYSGDRGFSVTPWLLIKPTVCWNDTSSTDFSEEGQVTTQKAGNANLAWPTGLALTRAVGTRQQRIFVLSDADCLDNAELTVNRPGIRSMNASLVSGLFDWLSNGEAPIDVRRPMLTDNKINLTMAGMGNTKLFFVWLLPAVFGVCGITLLAKRRTQ